MRYTLKVRSLAAAVIACALTDLLRGRDADGVLSWINGGPAALPFRMACQWLDINPQVTREHLEKIAANPAAYREPLRLVAYRTKPR